MKYNFDEIINREGTSSLKTDARKRLFGTEDVIPLWVADMDFMSPEEVTNALIERSKHPVYGYTYIPESFYQSIINWIALKHNWQIKKEWIVVCPGVVPTINMVIQAYSNPGDKVIVQPPVYYPFFSAVTNNRRELVYNQLKLENGRYYFDYENLENSIDKKTRLLILCSPHNPGGMVWTKEELKKLAEICLQKNVLILSDEIHSDLIVNNHLHTPPATLSEEISNNTIACYAPSKTFNIAGLSTSYVVIPDAKIRNLFQRHINNLHIGHSHVFGIVATEAAYNHGKQWLSELLAYIEENVEFAIQFIKKNIPELSIVRPEATFLLWIDFRKLGFTSMALKRFLIEEAKLGLSDGPVFGPGGEGFQRMNIACPKSVLARALNQLASALKN